MTEYLRRSTFARWVVVICASAGVALWTATATTQAPVTSTLTTPADGQTWTGWTFQWSAVSGADAYYLYVGTTVGANDVVNSGELHVTSKTVTTLPAGTTLYARMWTKYGGIWRYVDSTFSVYPLTATLTSPANGQTGVPLSGTFTWGSVPNVQAYYLYVGTTAGSNNVVNSGETLATSYAYAGLQPLQTYYARMWTKIANVWRYTDSTFTTAAQSATLTNPSSGATGVALSITAQWTSVPSAQAYYLYLGTAAGLKDLVNTGETTATSWPALLPPSTTVYARLWTKSGGTWRYVDSTFTTAAGAAQPVVANLSYPLNDAPQVPVPVTFQWNAIPNVQAYYLYVGTTTGANDLVNSRETMDTSWTATLPGSSTVHARLWTKVGNVWRYSDTKFGTQSVVARLSYPVTGLTVSTDLTFTWNSVVGAEGYTLDVGTSVGASDVAQVPEQGGTSAALSNLPQGQLLYARLGTRHGGVWRYSDSTFSTLVNKAVLTTPADAASGVAVSSLFQWTMVDGAQAYRLQIGSTAGSQNILDSGETAAMQWTVAVPDSSTLHARLWTKYDDTWRYVDSTFSTVNLRARFIHPVIGAVGVNPGQAFQWTAATGADGYTLQIGTAFASNDLLDTGEITATSYLPIGLPVDQALYARIRTRSGSTWRSDDTIFTLASSVGPSQIVEPVDGQSGFTTGLPFRWTNVAMANGYRLRIGTTPGGSDLHDSGEIFVTRRFVRNLPTGVTLYGQVQTRVGNSWTSTDFTFSVGSTTASDAMTVDTARWAVGDVRDMADAQRLAMPWSPLGSALNPLQLGTATANDFTQTLLTALSQINSGAQSRRLDVGFTPGTTEVHALVEFQRPDTSTWMLLDPMFALTVNKTSDSTSATAAEVSAATAAQTWADMTYEFLTTAGDAYATANYIDYPLLYLNVYANGVPPASPPSPEPYLLEVATPVSMADIYVIGCDGLPQTSATIDGQTVTVACNGPGTTSSAFSAGSIVVPSGSAFRVFTLRRFVF